MIIGISGKLKSGKDTMGDILVSEYNFTKISFADPLKQAIVCIFGWNSTKLYNQAEKALIDPYWGISPRQVLQLIGTDCLRNSLPTYIKELVGKLPEWGNDIWVKRLNLTILNNPDINYVITDVRFPNEAGYIQANKNNSLIRINPNYFGYEKPSHEHRSETALDNYSKWDYMIENRTSLIEFENEIHDILSDLELERTLV